MGKLTAVRNHLYNLFPSVFSRHPPENNEFCLVILDLMQFLAGKVMHHKEQAIDVDYLRVLLRQNVESYMPQYNTEYRASKAVVVLLDTPKNVPTNKATTQQKRDCEIEIIDGTLYDRYDQGEYGLGELLKWPLSASSIWRSNNARFQLYALLTEELLRIVPPPNVKLVIDDGVDINHDLYLERRQQMIHDYGFTERSTYEKECLVANLARHNFTERFVVRAGLDGQTNTVERLAQTFIGEADVKIPRFIKLNQETSRYLVVSQDTDLIFILLLHLKSVLPPQREQGSPEFQLWLDTQIPSDRKDGFSRPYRFINMKALYYEILALFATEYPTVLHPIETFVFLAYSLETDYTQAFNSYLSVTPRLVWNTFSALHTKKETIQAEGYLLFNDHMYDEQTFVSKTKNQTKESEAAKLGRKRSPLRHDEYPEEWHGLLSEAVSYTHDLENDHYHIELDDVKCQTFLYLLCQFKVLDDLAALGHTQFAKKTKRTLKDTPRTHIPNVDELFIWIARIEAQLETHRKETEESHNKRKAIEIPPLVKEQVKKPKLLQRYPPKQVTTSTTTTIDLNPRRFDLPKVNIFNLVDEIEEIEIDKAVVNETPLTIDKPLTTTTILKNLNDLCKKQIPKQYGIPTLEGMLARLFRITWLMNYHQNGWKTPIYMTNFSETHPENASLSRYGWRAEEVPQNEQTIREGYWNNAYYTSVYHPTGEPGVIPFRVYKMVETDQVYNRNYNHFV